MSVVSKLVAPHGGGSLRALLAEPGVRCEARRLAEALPRLSLSSRELSDVFMLGMGAYTPLDGFMGRRDWLSVCRSMQLTHGLFWPVPITLSQSADVAATLSVGDEVALTAADDAEEGGPVGIVATMTVREIYEIDKQLECMSVFRTADANHPGVAKVLAQGTHNIGGPVRVLSEGHYRERFPGLYMRPDEARAEFTRRGWSRVAAFQTRNPMHRSHEYLAKIAAEVCDGIFIHQVLGRLKPGDLPPDVCTRAIGAVIATYFKPGVAMQAGYPIEMRYAGPREALLHAVIRQNFGCSHLIVGRDHAGVGNYYGPYEAQQIFDDLWDGALTCRALKIGTTFYCRQCGGMATEKSCPHEASARVEVSGTRLREMLARGEPIPPEVTRPEVAAILRESIGRLP